MTIANLDGAPDDFDLFDAPVESEPHDFVRVGPHNRPAVTPARLVDGVWETVSDEPTECYTRISTLSDMISSGPGLTIWKTRHVALAVARSPLGVRQVIAGKEYGDKYLDHFIEKTLEQAKHSEPADRGTALHRWFESDAPREYLDEELRPDAEGYDRAMAQEGITPLEYNVKCVNDWIRGAGDTDGLYRMPDPYVVRFPKTGKVFDLSGRVIVGDAKTGQNYMPMKWAIQKAAYANSRRYSEWTGLRSELHPDLDTRAGLVIYAQLGTGVTLLKIVDLEIGWWAAQLCALVHAQGSKGQHIVADTPSAAKSEADVFLWMIRNAPDEPSLREAWMRCGQSDLYFDEVKSRYRELRPR